MDLCANPASLLLVKLAPRRSMLGSMVVWTLPTHESGPVAGNGSQWAGMTKDMLEFSPVYRAAVEECAAVLRPYAVDLMAEFASTEGFSDPTLAAVGLTAVQVGRAHRSLALKDKSHMKQIFPLLLLSLANPRSCFPQASMCC